MCSRDIATLRFSIASARALMRLLPVPGTPDTDQRPLRTLRSNRHAKVGSKTHSSRSLRPGRTERESNLPTGLTPRKRSDSKRCRSVL
jgi:hypothetical protein